jgi:hypothetical protein
MMRPTDRRGTLLYSTYRDLTRFVVARVATLPAVRTVPPRTECRRTRPCTNNRNQTAFDPALIIAIGTPVIKATRSRPTSIMPRATVALLSSTTTAGMRWTLLRRRRRLSPCPAAAARPTQGNNRRTYCLLQIWSEWHASGPASAGSSGLRGPCYYLRSKAIPGEAWREFAARQMV